MVERKGMPRVLVSEGYSWRLYGVEPDARVLTDSAILAPCSITMMTVGMFHTGRQTQEDVFFTWELELEGVRK